MYLVRIFEQLDGVALPRLDEGGPRQAFLAYLPDMSFLKLLKLKIEVGLSDQLPFPLYVVLFVVDGLFIKLLVIILIVGVLIVIVVGHDLVGLPSGRILSEIACTLPKKPAMPLFRSSHKFK